MRWAVLLHLGRNMWGDLKAQKEMHFDRDLWIHDCNYLIDCVKATGAKCHMWQSTFVHNEKAYDAIVTTNIFIKDNEMDEAEHIKATYSQEEIDNLYGFVVCPWVMMDPDKEDAIIEQIELLGKAKDYFNK